MRFLSTIAFSLGVCSLASAVPAPTGKDPVKLIHEFPKGTWIENLAVRPCGSVLLTEASAPNLWLVDPHTATPTLLHTFTDALALAGIAETAPDTFYAVVSNLSLSTFTVAPGSNRLFQIKFPPNSAKPSIELAASVPDALFLNGLTALNDNTILAADSFKGVVWAIDVATWASRVALSDPAFSPSSTGTGTGTGTSPPFGLIGVNGIHVHGDNKLYFTNTAAGTFGSVPIHRANGTAAGPVTILAHAGAGENYDDFALSAGAAFLVTGEANSLAQMALGGGGKKGGVVQTVVAGNRNSTAIAESTSAAFGRTPADAETVYVTTGGGLAVPVDVDGVQTVVGGQLVAVKVKVTR